MRSASSCSRQTFTEYAHAAAAPYAKCGEAQQQGTVICLYRTELESLSVKIWAEY